MTDDNANWKAERIARLKESNSFFSNTEKLNREKWVVRRLFRSLTIDFEESEIVAANEPGDVAFRNANFQAKEILDENRRSLRRVGTAHHNAAYNHECPQDKATSPLISLMLPAHICRI